MRRLVALAFVLFALPAHAQKGKHSSGSHSSRASASRPHYGGGTHTESHGGTFKGGEGSSHKKGHYVNPKTQNQYGTHKP